MAKPVKQQLNKKKSCVYAGFLHVFLLIVITASITFTPAVRPPQQLPYKQADKIVNAVSVNQTQVENEIAKIKQQQKQKQEAEVNRVAALKKATEHAEKLKQQQQAQLDALKKQQVAEQVKAKAELAKLKSQKQSAQQQLTQLQKNADKLKKQQKSAAESAAKKDLQAKLEAEQTQLDKQKQVKINNEIQKYTALMLQAMQQNWTYPANVNGALYCILEIKLAPGGKVTNVRLVKSSGNQLLDQSAITAVYKSSPLPVPSDPDVFKKMSDINLKASPQEQLVS